MGYYYTIYRPKTGNTRAELEIRYFCISTSDKVVGIITFDKILKQLQEVL